MTDREAFEAFFESLRGFPPMRTDIGYPDMVAHEMWQAWQAARRAALTEAAALVGNHKTQARILGLIDGKVPYGCHCDIETMDDGFVPDGCVFDNGDIEDCVYAVKLQSAGKGRDDCEYWKPIILRDRESGDGA